MKNVKKKTLKRTSFKMSKPRQMQHPDLEEEFQVRRAEPFHLGTFLYNADKGTVMNRDRNSWGKFFTSYLCMLSRGVQFLPQSNFTGNNIYTHMEVMK